MTMVNVKKKIQIVILICEILLLFGMTPVVLGQGSDFTVHVERDFGYGWGSDIQGTFTISLVGDEEVVEEVVFLIDGEVFSIVQEPPFQYQFSTDDFDSGDHMLSAEVQFKDGSQENTPAAEYHFITHEQTQKELTQVLLWIGGALIGVMGIAVIMQGWFLKNKKTASARRGEKRDYGLLGGAICPKCGYPFPRHIWGMNLIVGKLDRCEHCGKWVITRRASPGELQAAEEAELNMDQVEQKAVVVQKEEKDLLDETRYIDEL